MPALENLAAEKMYDLLHHLFFKHERVNFAIAFNCTPHLSYGDTYEKKQWALALENSNSSLGNAEYKNYPIQSLYGISTGIIHELNIAFKGLIRQDDEWAIHYFQPIHALSKHSYICLLHFVLNQIIMISKNLDRRLIVVLMVLIQGSLSKKNRLDFFTHVLECFLLHYKEKILEQQLIKQFQHVCTGEDITKCDPNKNLFYIKE